MLRYHPELFAIILPLVPRTLTPPPSRRVLLLFASVFHSVVPTSSVVIPKEGALEFQKKLFENPHQVLTVFLKAFWDALFWPSKAKTYLRTTRIATRKRKINGGGQLKRRGPNEGRQNRRFVVYIHSMAKSTYFLALICMLGVLE